LQDWFKLYGTKLRTEQKWSHLFFLMEDELILDRQPQILASQRQNIEIPTTVDSKFMVPYQRNANFTGRADLLAKLSTKLCDITPKSWNHRVALYGLGGVGKTQLALEYLYTHKGEYDRVYWISAVSQGISKWAGPDNPFEKGPRMIPLFATGY
jgi:hypothetical protein